MGAGLTCNIGDCPSGCCDASGSGPIEAQECTVNEMSNGGPATGPTIYICDNTNTFTVSNNDYAIVTICDNNAQICVRIIDTNPSSPPAATAEIYAVCTGTQAGEDCDCNTCGT